MVNNETKRENGQYFTRGNCFRLLPFVEWFNAVPNYDSIVIIEPFAGDGSIPHLMREAGYDNKWELYDLYPQQEDVAKEMKDKFPNYTAFREYVK